MLLNFSAFGLMALAFLNELVSLPQHEHFYDLIKHDQLVVRPFVTSKRLFSLGSYFEQYDEKAKSKKRPPARSSSPL